LLAQGNAALLSVLRLSIAIICRNNEGTISRTLESVAGLAAEIVAVDSGSTDGTIGLLERHAARVIRSEWKGHIATKQMALEACAQEWVLSLDSDESLRPELRRSIQNALQDPRPDPALAGWWVNRKVWYRDRPLNFAWQPEWRLRLVRRGRARWTGLDPHDRLEVEPGATTARLAGDLRHDSISTFPDFLAKQAAHSRTMAQSMHQGGRRGSYLSLITSPPGALLKQLVLKQAWRDGWPGWLAAGSTAAATLMKHIALIEQNRGERSGSGTGDGP
jgi:hypothetical protein